MYIVHVVRENSYFYILCNFYFVHTSGRSIDTTPEELEPFPVYKTIFYSLIYYLLFICFFDQKENIFSSTKKYIFSSTVATRTPSIQ